MSDRPSFAQLILVRHGESTANARNVLQGNTIDEPLSAKGREQARQAAEAVRRYAVTRVYSSALQRARETAAAIAAPHGLEVVPVSELHEVDVGEWAGMSLADIRRQMPEAWSQYNADHGEFPTPGGESYRHVLDRVRPVFQRLLEQHAGETIVAVTHNVVNRVFLADLLGIPLRRSTVLRQHNGAINIVRQDHGQTSVLTVNSVLHLDSRRK